MKSNIDVRGPRGPRGALGRGLWSHADFAQVWSAHTVSQVGSQITLVALPLTAALALRATPLEMGLLAATGTAPNLLFGLVAGAWVDRLPRRPVLIAMDLTRAALIAVVPALAALGLLRMATLYAVAFLAGVATLVFDLAAQSYLPALIGRDRLMEGNARLEASRSAATIAGPGLAGLVAQVVGAPFALIGDALSFLGSALFLARVRAPEAPHAPDADAGPRGVEGVRRDIVEGLRLVARDPILRAVFRTAALWNLFVYVVQAVLVLFATRDLRLPPGALGLALAMLGVGMLPGAALVAPARRRFGAGPTLIGSGFFAATSSLVLVAAGTVGRAHALPLLMASQFIFGLGPMMFGITNTSLRQAAAPDHLQGRVAATFRTVAWGTMPLGSLLGGALGARVGLLPTIAVGALGMVLAVALLLFSPLPALREPPAPAEAPDTGGAAGAPDARAREAAPGAVSRARAR